MILQQQKEGQTPLMKKTGKMRSMQLKSTVEGYRV